MNVNVSFKTVLNLLGLSLIAYVGFVYPWFLNWGATPAEQAMSLPGDELMHGASHYFTRAVTINAPVSEVWPWIIQMGQERGGFYSNTWLENLTGADIHNASAVWPQWQHRALGDWVLLARPNLFGGLFANFARTRIVALEPERLIADIPTRFVLQPIDSKSTRLLLREPLPASPVARAILAVFWDPAHFIMEQRMLRGIKERAENAPLVPFWMIWVARVGWLLASAVVAKLFEAEPYGRLWLLLPVSLAVLLVWKTGDWNSAIAAFIFVGITLIAARAIQGHLWPIYLVTAIVFAWILLLAPDPYIGFGIAFLLLPLVPLLLFVRYRHIDTAVARG